MHRCLVQFYSFAASAILAMGLAAGVSEVFAATLAAWDVNSQPGGANNFGASPLTPTIIDANVTVGGLTRGAGVGTTGTAAARAWGGNDWQNASAASAITGNDAATFTVTANAGFQVSFSAISKFDYRRSATGPASGVLQYQIGAGAFTDIATLSYTNTTSTGGSLPAIDLTGISALQNVLPGTTVTFRIVNYGGTSSGGTWYIFDVANSTAADFQIDGTVSTIGPVNGVCDSANGQSFTTAPTANLCSAGITSAVTGTGPWNWTCGGINGGTTASCSANLNTGPVNGVCGSANGQTFASAPSTNLCTAGTATSVTGSGPWSWNCNGANGGIAAVCSANFSVLTPIYTIQGSGASSPLVGQTVNTSGVVTKVNNNGFYLQDPVGDGNPLTSDGIFVFTSTAPTVTVGQAIQLTGVVSEFNTGAATNATTLARKVTELTSPTGITVTGAGTITPTVITLPLAAADDWERYEGMLVQITSPLTASQNYFQGRYGQVTLSGGGRLYKPTNLYAAGSPNALALKDLNARNSIMLDDGTSVQNPNPTPYIGADNTLRAGDTLPGGITGVIDYGLATSDNTGIAMYRIHPTVAPVFTRANARTMVPPAVGGNIKVASFNVLNFFTTFTNGQTAFGQSGQGCSLGASVAAGNCRGADDIAEFNRQRSKIVQAMAAINADVFGLMEIQNNGNTAAQNLVDALNAVPGAGPYAVVPLPPTTGTDAIRVAMIYKPATLNLSGVSMSDGSAIHNRPPFAQTFTTTGSGEKFSVLVNHFKSKSCDGAAGLDADQGDDQGCYNDRRKQQATALLSFISTIQAAANDNDVLVIGDLNAYGAEDPINIMTGAGLVNQVSRFGGTTGYSYVFDGEAGYLDHALATASLSAQINHVTHWHINADEPSIIDYNLEFKQPACGACGPDYYTATPYRASDHDPVLIGLNLQSVALTPQTITFVAPANRAVDSGTFAVVATATSGLAVAFTSNSPLICTVTAPNLVTLLSVGVCSLTASQPGDAAYAAALPVTRTFNVTAALLPQTISFGPLSDKVLGAAPFVVSATATSGLTVTLVSQSATICSVSGTTVTVLAVGTCVIDAVQAGNGIYAAAPVVTRSFTVSANAGGGGDPNGDVPIPLWALVLLALGMLSIMRSSRAGVSGN